MSTRAYVSVVIENQEKKFLIVKRVSDTRFAPGQWEFINGSIDTGETAEDTAVREVFEETRIKVSAGNLTAWPVHELTDDDGRWVVIPYNLKVIAPEVKLSAEHTECQWLDKETLLQVPHVGVDFRRLLELL